MPVKADGSIKKGGRAILIEELYRKYVLEGTEPVTRKQMIDLFVKEVGMTPAGASTYFANAKAKFGDPKGLIQSLNKSISQFPQLGKAQDNTYASSRLQRVFKQAEAEALQMKDEYISHMVLDLV